VGGLSQIINPFFKTGMFVFVFFNPQHSNMYATVVAIQAMSAIYS